MKTEDQRRSLLTSLGLDPDAPALVASKQPKVKHKTKQAEPEGEHDDIVLAPPGVDPHSMPVADIVFDPRLLDEYTDLSFKAGGRDASRKLFDLYKSPHKDPDRNGALNRKITSFITTTRRNRQTGGIVTEQIATTAEQRDIAALLAASGLTAGDLANMLKAQEANQ